MPADVNELRICVEKHRGTPFFNPALSLFFGGGANPVRLGAVQEKIMTGTTTNVSRGAPFAPSSSAVTNKVTEPRAAPSPSSARSNTARFSRKSDDVKKAKRSERADNSGAHFFKRMVEGVSSWSAPPKNTGFRCRSARVRGPSTPAVGIAAQVFTGGTPSVRGRRPLVSHRQARARSAKQAPWSAPPRKLERPKHPRACTGGLRSCSKLPQALTPSERFP